MVVVVFEVMLYPQHPGGLLSRSETDRSMLRSSFKEQRQQLRADSTGSLSLPTFLAGAQKLMHPKKVTARRWWLYLVSLPLHGCYKLP